MPKALHIILNVVRGIFLVVSLGGAAAGVIDTGSGAGDHLVYLNVAVTAGVVSISLSPRLWTAAASATTGPAQGSAGSVTVAPQHHQQPSQPGPPPTQPGQPQQQPGSGQVYGGAQVPGGSYGGQVYGQAQAPRPETGAPPSSGQDWQQRPGQ